MNTLKCAKRRHLAMTMDILGPHYLDPSSDSVHEPVQLKLPSFNRMHEQLIVPYQGNDVQHAHQRQSAERSAEQF